MEAEIACGLTENEKGKIVNRRGLTAGDLVEVRSKEEILQTLDANGQLEGLPFMPEMLPFCGRQFRVFKRAHKTCDTVNDYKSRRMNRAVHLEGLRCDGQAHGGCEAGCLMFWKEVWLRKIDSVDAAIAVVADLHGTVDRPKTPDGPRSEAVVHAGAQRPDRTDANAPIYVCQATQVPAATERLPWWDVSQYIEDYTSGNTELARMANGFIYRSYDNLIKLGIGLGAPLRWLYDAWQSVRGGIPYPARTGKIPVGERTPSVKRDLREGEMVRVKSYKAILDTLDQSARNRGMTFDAEMVPYCEGTYRVLKKVTRIINERTGKMQTIANPCIILDGVVCKARYSECRLFCPRSIYPYWREIWLERPHESPDTAPEAVKGEDEGTVRNRHIV
jgi:hypothetical protein